MSPFFVKKFKKENPCIQCTAYRAEEGRSMCSKHLRVARLEFVVWSALRMRAGRCIGCPKKVEEGNNCRCRKHREQNRVRCHAWGLKQVAANPNFYRDKQREFMGKWLAEGKCGKCFGHPPVVPGLTGCAFCVLRHKVSAGSATGAEKVEYRRQVRTRLRARAEVRQERVDRARQQLLELGYAAARKTSKSKDGWSIKSRVI